MTYLTHFIVLTTRFLLINYEVRGVNIKWFESYLADRKPRMDITSPACQQKILLSWQSQSMGPPGIHFGTTILYNLH